MQVVVIYPIEDQRKVRVLVQTLTAAKIEVGWDAGLRIGASWELEIDKLIRDPKTDHVLVCLSKSLVGAKRKQFRAELEKVIKESVVRGGQSTRFVVVVKLDDVRVEDVSQKLVELCIEPFDMTGFDVSERAKLLCARLLNDRQAAVRRGVSNSAEYEASTRSVNHEPLSPLMAQILAESSCSTIVGLFSTIAAIGIYLSMVYRITTFATHSLQIAWTSLLLIGIAFIGYGIAGLVSAYFVGHRALIRSTLTFVVIAISMVVYKSQSRDYREIVDVEVAKAELIRLRDLPSIQNIVELFPQWTDATRESVEMLKVQQFLVWIAIAVVDSGKKKQMGLDESWVRLKEIGVQVGAKDEQLTTIERFFRSLWQRR